MIRCLSTKRRDNLRLRDKLIETVWERDDSHCLDCGKFISTPDDERARAVHEIIPRSQFGHTTMVYCFVIENMCLLCPSCHTKAANQESRYRLLTRLQSRHGYLYVREKWLSVLRRE